MNARLGILIVVAMTMLQGQVSYATTSAKNKPTFSPNAIQLKAKDDHKSVAAKSGVDTNITTSANTTKPKLIEPNAKDPKAEPQDPNAVDPKVDPQDPNAPNDPNTNADSNINPADVPDVESSPDAEISDPLEPFNRLMYTFNDKIDIYILKPIATLYNKIMPKPLNTGIHNAFNNLETLPTIANDLLQLHFGQTTNDLGRFIINTTVGIGGLFDIGERIGLTPYTNDFGLTLARWGWRHSTYLVLPFFGPNTIRDSLKYVANYYYLSPYFYIYPYSTRYGLYALSVIDSRAQLLKFEEVLEEVAIDQYIFMRSAFAQRRSFQIEENLAIGFTGVNGFGVSDATGADGTGVMATGTEALGAEPTEPAGTNVLNNKQPLENKVQIENTNTSEINPEKVQSKILKDLSNAH